MLTAYDFLNDQTNENKYLTLQSELKFAPARLRQEFLAIATNPTEPYSSRVMSLSILSLYSSEMNASESKDDLIIAFRREFPLKKLQRIARVMQTGKADPDGFIAHMFCIALAKYPTESTREIVDLIKTTLQGTCLEAALAEHLRTIEGSEGTE
jgi:hypothetical protein